MRFAGIVLILSVLAVVPQLSFGALNAPSPISPTKEGSSVWKGKVEFQWTSTGADYYKYFIDLPSGERLTDTTSRSSVPIYGLEVGSYRWRISSCNDKKGTDCGDWSAPDEEFEIVPAPAGFSGGLIPCGREIDDTITTPDIDESAPCGLPHIFLLLKNILDFVLWKLGLLVIAIMAVLTGAISYFSFGGPGVLVKIKSMWRSLFVGYMIALFAWLVVNVILNVLGFQVQLFGNWWELPF